MTTIFSTAALFNGLAPITSRISTDANSFKVKEKQMLTHLNSVLALHQQIVEKTAGTKAKVKLQEKGKDTALGRIDQVIDEGTEFFELMQFAAHGGVEIDAFTGEPLNLPRAGIVIGIGKVHGKDFLIIANDPATVSGVYFPTTVKKHLWGQVLASQNNLAGVISLADSGGAMLEMQDEVFPERNDFGRIFYNMGNMSKVGIRQLTIALGTCIAGGAYIFFMPDVNIIEYNNGRAGLGGTRLVKAALGHCTKKGKDLTEHELCGAEVHKKSGGADRVAYGEKAAFEQLRTIIGEGDFSNNAHYYGEHSKQFEWPSPVETLPPRHNPEELYGIIGHGRPGDYRLQEVIKCIVDDSLFSEFNVAASGKNPANALVCGVARLGGRKVAIIGNHKALTKEAAEKGKEFIEMCKEDNIPMIFLNNACTHERGAHGAVERMLQAAATSDLPKITVTVGGRFDLQNNGLLWHKINPNLTFTYPNAGVIKGEAARIADKIVNKRKALLKGGEKWSDLWPNQTEKEYRQMVVNKLNGIDALNMCARLNYHGLLDPKNTRKTLIKSLETSLHAGVPKMDMV